MVFLEVCLTAQSKDKVYLGQAASEPVEPSQEVFPEAGYDFKEHSTVYQCTTIQLILGVSVGSVGQLLLLYASPRHSKR